MGQIKLIHLLYEYSHRERKFRAKINNKLEINYHYKAILNLSANKVKGATKNRFDN